MNEREMMIRQLATYAGWKAFKEKLKDMIIEDAAVFSNADLSNEFVRFKAGHSSGIHDILVLMNQMEQPLKKEDEADAG